MKRVLILGLEALIVTAAMAASQGRPAAAPKTGGQTTPCANFVDANGDGTCDNFLDGTRGAGQGMGRGKGDGTHVGPRDGTGAGTRTGIRHDPAGHAGERLLSN